MQVSTGEVQKLGSTRMYTGLDASPDGRFVIVSWLERPFSYTIPCGRFPKVVQLWDRLFSFSPRHGIFFFLCTRASHVHADCSQQPAEVLAHLPAAKSVCD